MQGLALHLERAGIERAEAEQGFGRLILAGAIEAGKTDDLTKSIHYGEVSRQIKEYMENHTCKLLETVAEGLAEELRQQHLFQRDHRCRP